jgi:hypothetical protein
VLKLGVSLPSSADIVGRVASSLELAVGAKEFRAVFKGFVEVGLVVRRLKALT